MMVIKVLRCRRKRILNVEDENSSSNGRSSCLDESKGEGAVDEGKADVEHEDNDMS